MTIPLGRLEPRSNATTYIFGVNVGSPSLKTKMKRNCENRGNDLLRALGALDIFGEISKTIYLLSTWGPHQEKIILKNKNTPFAKTL